MKKTLILAGDGLNCEVETRAACLAAEAPAEIVHLNDLIAEHVSQSALEREYGALIIPGGFSFGDEWGSGRILALKMKDQLGWDLRAFAEKGGWVLGICNGFQALIRLGIFGRNVSIMHNGSGQFINRWTELEVIRASGWLENVGKIALPIRHGEGRIVHAEEKDPKLENGTDLAIRYANDVNGSWRQAAALSAADGRILGMMPHPEAAIRGYLVPGWTLDPKSAQDAGPGFPLFLNLARHLRGFPSGEKSS